MSHVLQLFVQSEYELHRRQALPGVSIEGMRSVGERSVISFGKCGFTSPDAQLCGPLIRCFVPFKRLGYGEKCSQE